MPENTYDDAFFNELKIIQDNIDRFARNSFMIKGWTVTLVVASLLIEGTPLHNVIAFLPWIAFWLLDAYFLRIERCFRKLYEWLIVNRPKNRDKMFDMKAENRFGNEVEGIPRTMFSKTLAPFYLTVFVMIVMISYAATRVR